MSVTAGNESSNAVDLYNSASGATTTAAAVPTTTAPTTSAQTLSASSTAVSTAKGTWSTAQLSVTRWKLAATSVGNVAIFAGGQSGNSSFSQCVAGLLVGIICSGDIFVWLMACFACGFSSTACSLMKVTADSITSSQVVDVYNSASGTWSTAQLSVARSMLAATSVGNVAIFAGGYVYGNSIFPQCVEVLHPGEF